MKYLSEMKYLVIAFLIFSCSERTRDVQWKSIEKDLQTQFITTEDSLTIDLPAGYFMFTKSLILDGKKHITIQGAGISETILSFAMQAQGAEGIKISNSKNIVLKDFTIEDAIGDNIKVSDTDGITFSGVKSHWTGGPKEENGAYGFYPVLSKNVLIENCIAVGASDAGIYVGQSDSVIIRNNIAYHNVAGIESENSKWVEIYGNQAYRNTGGILIFDLPGLTQFGHTTRVYQNLIEKNNYRNFAPAGNIVATVPPGTGMMLLATRNIEIFNNQFIDNKTAGLAIASYDLVESLATADESQLNENIETAQKDERYDPYAKDIYVHHNEFNNSHLFPTVKNDFGILFLMKFPFSTPDIVWDGIVPDRSTFGFCISDNGEFKFADLDAANDFEALTSDWSSFSCISEPIEAIFGGRL